MLIARATSDDGEALVLGLSRGNIDRLTAGKPMRISRETHGDGVPEGWSILVLYGETEQAIADELKAAGAVGAHTKVTVDPKLKRGG